jgi:hypothetical protein
LLLKSSCFSENWSTGKNAWKLFEPKAGAEKKARRQQKQEHAAYKNQETTPFAVSKTHTAPAASG